MHSKRSEREGRGFVVGNFFEASAYTKPVSSGFLSMFDKLARKRTGPQKSAIFLATHVKTRAVQRNAVCLLCFRKQTIKGLSRHIGRDNW